MTTPVSTVDRRFSQADAVAADWEQVLAVITAAELFWITTVRADGRPHVTPLVAVWVDDALYFCTGAGEQKELNLAGNQHVILTTGRNDWDNGLDVVLEGDAVRVRDDDELKRLAQAWTAKWDGRWQYEVRDGAFAHPGEGGTGGGVLVFRVAPRKVLSFGKGDFIHTSHKF